MVRPGEIVSFKLGRAYVNEGVGSNILRIDDTPGGSPEPYGDDDYEKFEAVLLWDDADVIRSINVKGKGPDAELTVITDKGKDGPIPTGNAVVAIRKNTGEIAWSYHIWVTEDIQTWTNPNSKVVLMDRNLGATEAAFSHAAHGLLYQWGRKDPFPGGVNGVAGYSALNKFKGMPDSGEPGPFYITTPAAEGIIESIQHPTTFFSSVEVKADWLPNGISDRWDIIDQGVSKKTIYDPCPPGWRVPRHRMNGRGVWDGYENINYTTPPPQLWFNFDSSGGYALIPNTPTCIYPAHGYRMYNTGRIINQYRYVNLFIANGVTGQIGKMYIDYLHGLGVFMTSEHEYNHRSQGCGVRCVQE
jgi:hypothetical protein